MSACARSNDSVMKLKRLTRLALLTAIALTIFLVELQIPSPVPIPGVKLGLSNIVTLYCVFAYGPWSALSVLICRVLLGALCSGRIMTLAYSLAGGLLSWALSCLMRHIVTERQLWIVSVLGGLAHNTGQMLAAVAIAGTRSLWVYYPVLCLTGMAAGLFTGLCAQYLLARMRRIGRV